MDLKLLSWKKQCSWSWSQTRICIDQRVGPGRSSHSTDCVEHWVLDCPDGAWCWTLFSFVQWLSSSFVCTGSLQQLKLSQIQLIVFQGSNCGIRAFRSQSDLNIPFPFDTRAMILSAAAKRLHNEAVSKEHLPCSCLAESGRCIFRYIALRRILINLSVE